MRALVWVALTGAVAACGGETSGGLFEGAGAAGAANSGAGGADQASSGGAGDAGRHAGTAGEASGAVAGRSNSGGASGGAQTAGSGGKGTQAGGASGGVRSGAGGSAGIPPTTATGGRSPSLMDAPGSCEPVSQSSTDQQCNFEFNCEGKTNFASCDRQEDGSWACDCGTFSGPSQRYEVEDMPPLEACGVVARACKGNPTPGARTCETKSSTSVMDRCNATATCGPTLDLDGVPLRAVEEYSVQCRAGGEGEPAFTCGCKGGPLKNRNFEVSGKSVEALCAPFLDFCTADEEPAFPTSESCEPASTQSNGGQGCFVTQDCESELALGAGASLVEPRNRYVACEGLGGGKSYCDCQEGIWTMSFDAPINAAQPSSCTSLLGSCQRGLAVEETGSAACQVRALDLPDPATCYADLTCDRAVRIGGTNLVGHGMVALGCQRDPASGSWWCSCASNWDATRFELGSAADAVSACNDAVPRCESELQTFIGLFDRYPELPARLPEP
ncbi:MAG: hypothetical protein M3020_09370 [Myxococcota bacterium]|nr:hypothetical protein [Myxococcota bacterium]